MKTLVISGSIRSSKEATDYIFDLVKDRVDHMEEYVSELSVFQNTYRPVANSDILSGAVLLGMKITGAEIDYFPLKKLFPLLETPLRLSADENVDLELKATDTLAINQKALQELLGRIENANGVVLVSPVYFGDRSSVANKLLQLSGIHNLLQDKVFGAAAVGAKRNGGQETTIIYSLLEALNQSALVVGNGPPTSQYGGTSVGGKKGSVLEDSWGLETSFGTGVRVAHVSAIVDKGGKKSLNRSTRILILVTMDDVNQTLNHFLHRYISQAEKVLPHVTFKIVYVLDSTIYRCLGCSRCPAAGNLPPGVLPSKEKHGQCVIQDGEDAMDEIHCHMLDSDGIIIAGLNVKEHAQLVYRYQVLIERTRFIRRNHFELSEKLITALSLNQVGSRINALHSVKTVTSYLRHNSIIHKPIEISLYEDKILDDGMEDLFSFVRFAGVIAAGREQVPPIVPQYQTGGIGGY